MHDKDFIHWPLLLRDIAVVSPVFLRNAFFILALFFESREYRRRGKCIMFMVSILANSFFFFIDFHIVDIMNV